MSATTALIIALTGLFTALGSVFVGLRKIRTDAEVERAKVRVEAMKAANDASVAAAKTDGKVDAQAIAVHRNTESIGGLTALHDKQDATIREAFSYAAAAQELARDATARAAQCEAHRVDDAEKMRRMEEHMDELEQEVRTFRRLLSEDTGGLTK